jgi:hypothetical protein
MSLHGHSTSSPASPVPGPRGPGRPRGAPAQAAATAASHHELLHAAGQLDRLLDRLDEVGLDEVGRTLARALVLRFDQLLDIRFADQEMRLFALFRRAADAGVRQAADALRVDHEWITGNWRELRSMLDGVARSYCWADIDALRGAVELFVALVRDHVGQEAALLARA